MLEERISMYLICTLLQIILQFKHKPGFVEIYFEIFKKNYRKYGNAAF